MESASLPPGFRFHPTDEELVGYYLKRKNEGLEIELEVIPVIDLYKFDPWELPEKSFLPKRDMEWFFFCYRDKKYPNGSRTNRATKSGYWKATGKDRKVVCESQGYRKTLVFYRGRAPLGDRTDWIMHEYRLCDDVSKDTPSFQGSFALCRVVKKNGNTDKTFARGDATLKPAGNCPSSSDAVSNEPVVTFSNMPSQTNDSYNESNHTTHFTSQYPVEPTEGYNLSTSLWGSPNIILDSYKECYPQYDMFPYLGSSSSDEQHNISQSSSYSSFREEVGLSDDQTQYGCISPYLFHESYDGYPSK
ncbi:NAC domain-containing protein 71-like [Olea europaea var. sylvestris]|uniref:NAC domain-containing protein 71-like n=1 Tax=Olea europaea var. sylvestris TaxID=158386 RepID=UPI000C1D3FE9|nr:NAC domain-containing protein 71-like [Olea europaea var. sylvestris]